MKKTVIIEMDNRTFEVFAHTDFDGMMICYSIDEVIRPNWKFFRTAHRTSGAFWLDDHDSVMGGLRYCLTKMIMEDYETAERYRKFEEFANTY